MSSMKGGGYKKVDGKDGYSRGIYQLMTFADKGKGVKNLAYVFYGHPHRWIPVSRVINSQLMDKSVYNACVKAYFPN